MRHLETTPSVGPLNFVNSLTMWLSLAGPRSKEIYHYFRIYLKSYCPSRISDKGQEVPAPNDSAPMVRRFPLNHELGLHSCSEVTQRQLAEPDVVPEIDVTIPQRP